MRALLLLGLCGCVDYASLSSASNTTDLGGVPTPDALSVDLAVPACRPLGNDCAASEKCTLVGGGFGCRPSGPLQEGALCSTSDDQCGNGLLCSGDFAGTVPTCHRMCAANTDCPQIAGPAGDLPACIVSLNATTLVHGCTKPCNPLASATNNLCAVGLKCEPSGGQTLCGHAGTGVAQSPCTLASDCAQGFACLVPGNHCVAVCLSANDCQPIFETCSPFSNATYGACCSVNGTC
jgi:hypothetical protein